MDMTLTATPNMDLLLGHPGAVIRCKNETEASQLLGYLKSYYPDKVSNWRKGRTEWDIFKERTVYHVFWDFPTKKMLYGSINGVVHGDVFEFEDLLCQVPELPTCFGDMPIESLFG